MTDSERKLLSEEALADTAKALELSPANPAAFLVRGEVYLFLAREYPRAIRDLTDSIRGGPSAAAYAGLGWARYQLKQYQLAVEDFTQALLLAPARPDLYRFRALAYQGQSQSALAIADLTKALELKPDDATAYLSRGIIHGLSGQHTAALSDLDQALRVLPGNPQALFRRAESRMALQQYKEALADLHEAVHLQSDFAEAYLDLGQCYMVFRRFGDAVPYLTLATGLKPDFWQAYTKLAVAHRTLGSYDLAIADATKALQITPPGIPNVVAHWNRGESYYQLKQYGEALADFNDAIRLQPGFAGSYWERGLVKEGMGDTEGAKADKAKALQLGYRPPEEPPYVAHWKRGHSYRLSKQYASALAELNEAIRLQPAFADAYGDRAFVKKALGDTAGADADFVRELQLKVGPGNGRIVRIVPSTAAGAR